MRALHAIAEVSEELALSDDAPREVSAAIVLTKLGVDLPTALGTLAWREFEDYCAAAISAAGFQVSTNVRLRKPTREIDIVGTSPSLVLSVDCKHWGRAAGPSGLESLAGAQAERTLNYARARGVSAPLLPVIVTLVESRVRVVAGVPVVPIAALKSFLASVSPFEEGFAYVRMG